MPDTLPVPSLHAGASQHPSGGGGAAAGVWGLLSSQQGWAAAAEGTGVPGAWHWVTPHTRAAPEHTQCWPHTEP